MGILPVWVCSSLTISTAKPLKSDICTGRLRFLTLSAKALTSFVSLGVRPSVRESAEGDPAASLGWPLGLIGGVGVWILCGQRLAMWPGLLHIKQRLIGANGLGCEE